MMIIPISEGGLIVYVGNHSPNKGHNLKLNGSQTQITHKPPLPPSTEERIHTKNYLNKLYQYNITTLAQIQNLENTAIIFHEEFKHKHRSHPQAIKNALNQANAISPPPPPPPAGTISTKPPNIKPNEHK